MYQDSRVGKEAAVKVAVLIVAAIATLTLAAPLAYSATAKQRPANGNPAKGPKWRVIQDGTGKITVIIGRRIVYVYYPAPAQPPVSTSTADNSDDCVDYEVNCTDEQDCQYWGVNCDRIATPGTDTQPLEQDSSAADTSTGQAAAEG